MDIYNTARNFALWGKAKPPELFFLYEKRSISFLSKFDKTSQSVNCAIQYSKSKVFFFKQEGKKLSE